MAANEGSLRSQQRLRRRQQQHNGQLVGQAGRKRAGIGGRGNFVTA